MVGRIPPSKQEAEGSYIAQAAEGGVAIVIDGNENIVYSLSPAQAQEAFELRILLDKVKQFWIDGVLKDSLHNEILLQLNKEVRLDEVEHPWERVMEVRDRPRQSLPAAVKIGDVFDEMSRAMLILGAPGAGKTITLLELARDLIAQVEGDPNFSKPIPVVFNLSSWAEKRKPFLDWLVDELSAKYFIPGRTGRIWLENYRVLPLLDGLDELPAEHRASCVESINTFGENHGLSGLAVCCRAEEYSQIPVRLKFNGAIFLQPLTPEQVDNYFAVAGQEYAGIQAALKKDEGLQTLSQTPLMLSILALASQGMPTESLTVGQDDVIAARKRIFEMYITRMFARKGQMDIAYSPAQTKEWLAWFAQKMFQHDQSIFLIENMQPSWLLSRFWRWVYLLVSRLLSGLFFGYAFSISGGLIDGLLDGLINALSGGLSNEIIVEISDGFRDALSEGFIPGSILAGIIGGLCVGLLDIFRFERRDIFPGLRNVSASWKLGLSVIVTILVAGLPFGFVVWSSEGTMISGLVGGLIFGLIFGLRNHWQSLTSDIQTVESLKWYWGRALKSGLISGLIVGLITSWIVAIKIEGLLKTFGDLAMFWALALLTFILIGGLIGVMFGGLNSSILETKTVPGQGIRLSLRNAGRAWIVFTLMFALVFALISGVTSGLATVIQEGETPLNGLAKGLLFGVGFFFVKGLLFGMTEGLLAALWYGGLDLIQHYTLRFILWRNGRIPRNLTDFLGYASDRIFLRKVGGGYIFAHRLLMEHFASLKIGD